ncbi:MAG: virulence factor TspB C-terminal domain-related protein [Candidatus Methanomethylicaceae archaeon]
MGLSRLFGLCAALLFASTVSAAVTIDLGPSDWRRWGDGTYHHHTNGLNAKFGQTVRMPPMNTNLTVSRNPIVPYGSIANGAKNFVRINPASVAASAAITGLFLAVDWVFDEALDSWAKQGEDIVDDPELTLWSYCSGTNCVYGPTDADACTAVGVQFLGGMVLSPNPVADNTTRCVRSTGQTVATVERTGACPAGSLYSPTLRGCVIEGEYIPVTDSDFQELEAYLPSAPAPLVGDAAGDIQRKIGSPLPGYTDLQMEGPGSVTGTETTTTTTDPVTGDTIVTTTQTTTNIQYGDTTITTTNTTTSNTYNNGNLTSTETTTETPGELPVSEPSGGGIEWPGFCEWASIVCDWIGWTQEEPPAEPDLPQVIDDDFYEEKAIRFGSKSCPPDYEINVPFINSVVAVPMQPLCDFAGIIYYMVMAAAYIIAAYITIGVARNG